ncbi:MAG: hypothetical protein ABIP06_10900 [Pyrinomonadaceae bacterium]
MTPQEIVKTVRNWSPDQKQEVLEALRDQVSVSNQNQLSEQEVQQILFERGVIGNLPNNFDYTDADDDFEPLEIKGKPLSEIVIEERR